MNVFHEQEVFLFNFTSGLSLNQLRRLSIPRKLNLWSGTGPLQYHLVRVLFGVGATRYEVRPGRGFHELGDRVPLIDLR